MCIKYHGQQQPRNAHHASSSLKTICENQTRSTEYTIDVTAPPPTHTPLSLSLTLTKNEQRKRGTPLFCSVVVALSSGGGGSCRANATSPLRILTCSTHSTCHTARATRTTAVDTVGHQRQVTVTVGHQRRHTLSDTSDKSTADTVTIRHMWHVPQSSSGGHSHMADMAHVAHAAEQQRRTLSHGRYGTCGTCRRAAADTVMRHTWKLPSAHHSITTAARRNSITTADEQPHRPPRSTTTAQPPATGRPAAADG